MPSKKVLLVEDDKTMNMLLMKHLEKHGFTVDGCFDGRAAIEAMEREAYDAILLDLLLPEVDGFEVLQKKAGTKSASAPVYVLTNLGTEVSLNRARDLGATEVFVKAMVSPKDVIARMEKDIGE